MLTEIRESINAINTVMEDDFFPTDYEYAEAEVSGQKVMVEYKKNGDGTVSFGVIVNKGTDDERKSDVCESVPIAEFADRAIECAKDLLTRV